jgi:hypothetical protein
MLIALMLFAASAKAQYNVERVQPPLVRQSWKMDRNKITTGVLLVLAGASKGFNETLMFHWDAFHKRFPNANPQWYNPEMSWKNKYREGNPALGARYPLSTSTLVMFTDQYHLDNFINKTAWMSAVMIRMGEGKKPFTHYLLDMLYYTACHQLGFAMTYYPFSKNHKK